MTIVDRLAWLLCDRTENERDKEYEAPTMTNLKITYSWPQINSILSTPSDTVITSSPYTTSGSYFHYPETA